MSGGGTNTVQTNIPSWVQPYLTGELSAASNLTPGLSGSPGGTIRLPNGQTVTIPATGGVDPNSLVAPLNATQKQGLADITNTANSNINPSASAAAANQWETSGALLNPENNPYLKNTFNLAANSVQNQLATEFAGNGSNVINSLPVQSDEMNNLATQLYGGAYQQGLNTMTQASALAPSIQSGTYLPGEQLYTAGQTEQQQAQNQINAPYNALSWYSSLLGLNGSSGMGQTSSQSGNPWSTAIGAGIGAYGLYSGLSSLFAGMGSGYGAAAAAAL